MEWIEIICNVVFIIHGNVSTLAVEWIEILLNPSYHFLLPLVSTLAVEWIEIFLIRSESGCVVSRVSTLAVEWIEIPQSCLLCLRPIGLHPRGGVD